jgi:hypothetical protein
MRNTIFNISTNRDNINQIYVNNPSEPRGADIGGDNC